MFSRIRADLVAAAAPGGWRAVGYALFLSLGFRVVVHYRIASWLRARGLSVLARLVTNRATRRYGAELSPLAVIGNGIRLPHSVGIVVGNFVRIGADCTIYQGVTLGTTDPGAVDARYPTVEDGVSIFPGAKILGAIRVAHQAVVGAGSVVLKDVPAHSVVAGVPARVLSVRDFEHCAVCETRQN